MDRKLRSAIFTAYNLAENARKKGAFKIDRPTLNKGLGLALSGEQRPYQTSVRDCNCPHRMKTKKVCKHMAAEMILGRARHPHSGICPHLITTLIPGDILGEWVHKCVDCGKVIDNG